MVDPMDLAIEEAHRSDHNFKHGAVVVKKGKIIQSGRNQYCSLQRIRHFQSNRIWSIHAEMNVLAGLPKKVTKGADIYIVRVRSDGQLSNSKPCKVCAALIQNAGIRRIFYSVDNNVFASTSTGPYRKEHFHGH